MKKLLLCLALLASPLFAQDTPENRAQALILQEQSIILLTQQGDAHAALTLLDAAIALYEKTFAEEKRRIYAAHNPTETLYYLTTAAHHNEDAVVVEGLWADLWYLRAYTQMELGNLQAGKKDLDATLALAPAHAMAHNERGNYYTMEKEWDKAEADFQAAIDLNFSDDAAEKQATTARAKRGLGYILIERGQWDAAQALYEGILADNPNDEKAQQELQYIQQNRP